MTTLHGRGRDGTTLAEAVTAADLDSGSALLSSAGWHRMARVVAGTLHDWEGRVDLAPVFEARVFDGVRELRWLNESGGRGRAVLLAEDDAKLPAGFGETLPAMHAFHTLDQQHLLWGEAEPSDGSGWTTLYAPRIGSLTVPVETSDRVRLIVREYVAVEAEHGNAYVADERLVGLVAYSPEGAP